jgi:4-hydroxy-tetrahydrodipicolinate reductase
MSTLHPKPNDLRIFLVGSTGRMGKALLSVLGDPILGQGFHLDGACSGRKFDELSSIETLHKGTVVIDFSSPAAAIEASWRCARSGSFLLECSTGFSDSEIESVKKNMSGHAWALTPNTSLGVFVMGMISQLAAELLPADYSFSLWESHHAGKKDAPSGTAKLLKKYIEDASGKDRLTAVQSVRGGTEVGNHRLDILGPFENIKIEHVAQDRRLFAIGALKLAKILSGCAPRVAPYTPAELWTSLSQTLK